MRRAGDPAPEAIRELAELHDACVHDCMEHLTEMHTAMAAFFGGDTIPRGMDNKIDWAGAARVHVYAGHAKNTASDPDDNHTVFTVDLMRILRNPKEDYLYPNRRSGRHPGVYPGNLENAAANLNATLFLLRNLFEHTRFDRGAQTFNFRRAVSEVRGGIGHARPIKTEEAPLVDPWHAMREAPDTHV